MPIRIHGFLFKLIVHACFFHSRGYLYIYTHIYMFIYTLVYETHDQTILSCFYWMSITPTFFYYVRIYLFTHFICAVKLGEKILQINTNKWRKYRKICIYVSPLFISFISDIFLSPASSFFLLSLLFLRMCVYVCVVRNISKYIFCWINCWFNNSCLNIWLFNNRLTTACSCNFSS